MSPKNPSLVFLLVSFVCLSNVKAPFVLKNDSASAAACGTPGTIESGSSAKLDPNADGYFSIYTGSGFTVSSNEYLEFEALASTGGANLNWTPLEGSESANDLFAGGGCGNTDIVEDSDGGSDYAYYSIVDPDNTADNGDEYLVFALRLSDKINGSFGFTFLLDIDNNCNTGDADAVCGNPCFEYEVQLSTNNKGGSVVLYNIDGCYGSSDCDTEHGSGSVICDPCNSEAIQVCAGSSACPSGDPVFWVYYIDFSDIPGLNSSSLFSITPASNTSGNAIIYKSGNVSDYAGVDDSSDINDTCDCATTCSGDPCSNCEQDCALKCISGLTNINSPLPIHYLNLSASEVDQLVEISWEVNESSSHSGYILERINQNSGFTEIGSVNQMNNKGKHTYTFIDQSPQVGANIYRVVHRDFNGKPMISPKIEIYFTGREEKVRYVDHKKTLDIYRASRYNVFDITGKSLFASPVKPLESHHQIDVALWDPGIYFVKGADLSGEAFAKKIFIRN